MYFLFLDVAYVSWMVRGFMWVHQQTVWRDVWVSWFLRIFITYRASLPCCQSFLRDERNTVPAAPRILQPMPSWLVFGRCSNRISDTTPLSLLRFFVVFFSLSRYMPGWYLGYITAASNESLSSSSLTYPSTIWLYVVQLLGRLCGLVVRVPGYRSRGPGFDSRRYQIFWEVVGL
jgi:hypothetical protein